VNRNSIIECHVEVGLHVFQCFACKTASQLHVHKILVYIVEINVAGEGVFGWDVFKKHGLVEVKVGIMQNLGLCRDLLIHNFS
jgi:hypothetical protein